MATAGTKMPGFHFPRETFARLTPGPYLQAHLELPNPVRPNGRSLDEFRTPTINVDSLSHGHGSAVVRLGNTAMVCGVRAEVLRVADMPQPLAPDSAEDDAVEHLGLLVPNIELSTGCSPNFLPGNPPGPIAQTLSWRLSSALYQSRLIRLQDLTVEHEQQLADDEVPDAGPQSVVKAYWVLYIDILCIALDGDPFDAAWAAMMAALRNTVIPKAWWDPDREAVCCSPEAQHSAKLSLASTPVASTFVVYSSASPLKARTEARNWIIADPDGFENELCEERVTIICDSAVATGSGPILRIEKFGGSAHDASAVSRCVPLAQRRADEWQTSLKSA